MCRENKEYFLALCAALLLSCVLGVVLKAEEPEPGKMRSWSQTSGLNSNDSSSISSEWDSLFNQGLKIYNEQSKTLASLTSRILTLESGYGELTDLSGQLLQSNENLRRYNEQYGERMQGKDEEIYRAYMEIKELKQDIHIKDNTILGMAIAIGVLSLVIIAAIVIAVLKLYFKVKFPFFK